MAPQPPVQWQDKDAFEDIMHFLAYQRCNQALKSLMDSFIQSGNKTAKGSDLDIRMYLAGVHERVGDAKTTKHLQALLDMMESRRDIFLKGITLREYLLLRLKVLSQICLSHLHQQLPDPADISDRQLKKLNLNAYMHAKEQYFPQGGSYYQTEADEGQQKDDFVAQMSAAEFHKLNKIYGDSGGKPDKDKISHLLWNNTLDGLQREMADVIKRVEEKVLPPPKLKQKPPDQDSSLGQAIESVRQPIRLVESRSWSKDSLSKDADHWRKELSGRPRQNGGSDAAAASSSGGGGRAFPPAPRHPAPSLKKGGGGGGGQDKRKWAEYRDEEEEDDDRMRTDEEDSQTEAALLDLKTSKQRLHEANKKHRDPLTEALHSDEEEEAEEDRRAAKLRKQSHGGGGGGGGMARKKSPASAAKGKKDMMRAGGGGGGGGKQIKMADSQWDETDDEQPRQYDEEEEEEIQDDEEEEGEEGQSRRPQLPKGSRKSYSTVNLAPRPRAMKQPRSRKRFSQEEEEYLRKAVQEDNMYGDWATILANGKREGVFEPTRTSVDIKDKWRNMNKAGRV